MRISDKDLREELEDAGWVYSDGRLVRLQYEEDKPKDKEPKQEEQP